MTILPLEYVSGNRCSAPHNGPGTGGRRWSCTVGTPTSVGAFGRRRIRPGRQISVAAECDVRSVRSRRYARSVNNYVKRSFQVSERRPDVTANGRWSGTARPLARRRHSSSHRRRPEACHDTGGEDRGCSSRPPPWRADPWSGASSRSSGGGVHTTYQSGTQTSTLSIISITLGRQLLPH